MKLFTKFSAVAALLACASAMYGQVTTRSTTLSAVLSGYTGSNGAGSPPTLVCLTSSTGVAANTTGLMIGREFLIVNSASTNANCWNVTRGYAGTTAYYHASGETVYVGPTGGTTSSPFINNPPAGGTGSYCLATSQSYLPKVVAGASGYIAEIGGVWDCPTSGANANKWVQISTPLMAAPQNRDFEIFVPAGGICSAGTSGTVGTGNGTVILDGAVPALKASSTNAAGSTSSFNCNLTAALRTTAGKGITLNSITVVYSVQTTTATSMGTPTISLFDAPASGTSEAASSATLVTTTSLVGGTLTMLPAVGSANLTAVSAGQYYTEKITLGTPLTMNTDLRTYVLNFTVLQSASAAQIVTVPGIWLRGYQIPL